MNKIAQRVWDLALPVAQELGLELWDVEYCKEAGQWYLRVYIDRTEGYVGIDDCEKFSRAFDPILDEADPIESSYTFEVSSAGAERTLKRPGDFPRFYGETVEVKLYQTKDGRKSVIGTLKNYEDGTVTVETAAGEERFAPAQIAQVRLRLV